METDYRYYFQIQNPIGGIRMNGLQIFNFEQNEVRTIVIDDEPYFLGNDVAEILGYERLGDALAQHVDIEDKKTLKYKAFGEMAQSFWKGNDYSNKTVINETGMYALIFGSALPSAKKFKRWVTSDVLPQIRKHGMYAKDELLNNPDLLLDVVTKYKEERTQRLMAEQRVLELQPKATYYDLVIQNKSLLSVTKIAKDYGMSARKMNSLLHEYGVQFKQGDMWFLYQDYADKGYTQSFTHVIDDENSRMSTKWTQKGRLFIYETLKNHGYLPLIER